jgi:hypothetical protein
MTTAGGELPNPLRFAVAGMEPAVASVTVRVAVLLTPGLAGLYTTWIAQVVSGASKPTHLLSVIAKSAALTPPSAVIRAPVAEPPVLATLKVMAALGEPTAAENAPRLGVITKLVGLEGAVPTPLKETVRPGATVRTPLAAPTDFGENLTATVQLAAAIPQVVLSSRNPEPVTVGKSETGVPLLVTVPTLTGDTSPSATVPKSIDDGLVASTGAGGTPIP